MLLGPLVGAIAADFGLVLIVAVWCLPSITDSFSQSELRLDRKPQLSEFNLTIPRQLLERYAEQVSPDYID